MLLAMSVVVLKVIALVFQRIAGLVFDLPPRPPTPHEVIHVPCADAQVRHPAKVLDLVMTNLPLRDEIDPHVWARGIQRHLIHKPKAMDNPCSAVVPFIIRDAPRRLRHLHLLEPKGMIACFDPKDIMQSVVLQRLAMGRMGTQAVFGDDALEMRVVLASLGHQALGGMPFALIFARAILLHHRLRPQRNHFTPVWMEQRRAQHRMSIRDRTVAVDLLETRRTVNRLRGKVPVPSSARQEWPSRHAIDSSALPRCNGRKMLLNTGRSTLGDTGSRI